MKKRQKTYFSDFEEDFARTKAYLLDEMKERELVEITVSEAERDLGSSYFYCWACGEVGEKGESEPVCGKNCDDYEPRNGKSGCCKHRGFCYIPGKEFILHIDGTLTNVDI